MEQDSQLRPRAEVVDRLEHQPRVSDALKSGVAVSITTWGGKQLRGAISDRDPAGILLNVDEESNGTDGYLFVPWSSVEQVEIPEIAHRRVKFLQS